VALAPGDAFHTANRDLPLIQEMIAQGFTGLKGKGGFYRLNRANGGKTKEAIDLATGLYRPVHKPEQVELNGASNDLRALLSGRQQSRPVCLACARPNAQLRGESRARGDRQHQRDR